MAKKTKDNKTENMPVRPGAAAKESFLFQESELADAGVKEPVLPSEEDKEQYVLLFCPCGSPPATVAATGMKQALKKLRAMMTVDDQLYAFVVRGELGKIAKAKGKLVVSFAGKEGRIPLDTKVRELKDGWLGD